MKEKEKKTEIIPLFPTPLYTVNYGGAKAELEFIQKLDYKDQPRNGNKRSKDTYILKQKALETLSDFITVHLKIYARDILTTPETIFVTQSWANCNPCGSNHHEHIHANSIVSGVFYVNKNDDLPPIRFSRDQFFPFGLKVNEFNFFNSTAFAMTPKEGSLILFPSTLRHSVSTNIQKEKRYSISFNTFAKTLGEKERLNYVQS